MQPSSTWGTPTGYYLGLNMRTGASDLSNPDFTNYPAFILGINSDYPLSDKGIVQSFIETDKLQLNTAITDWSIAYTAVDNPELGQSNVGVYLSDAETPAYTTNPDNYAKIAFLSSYSYTTIKDNIVVNIPEFTNYTLDFWQPPYSNSRKIWAPNAAPKSGSSDMGQVYQQSNYNGYANIVYSFGTKSLFLEICVDSININTNQVEHYTLKEYNALTAQQKTENPIAKAYARVYRRVNTNGTYGYASGDHRDNFRLVLSEPLRGANDGGGIYDYYINTTAYIGLTEPLILPIFGNYKDDITDVRYNITENAANLFYGHNKVDNIIQRQIDEYDRYTYYTMQGSDDNIEWIRRTCAAYGLFFCDDVQVSETVNLADSSSELTRWTDDGMMLGIIESDGYTRGNYSHGADNADQSQFNWSDSTDSTYDPHVTPIPTENEYSRQTKWNLVGDLTTLTKRYVLNAAAVQHLGRELWTISSDLINDGQGGVDYNNLNDKMLDSFLTQNPIDCIVDLRRYPMEIPKADSCLLKLGKYETIVGGYTMEKTVYNYLFELRQPIYPLFGDSFIDYEPYTHFELYIPFCGTVSIEPADILGRKLAVQLVVDFTTGTATAYVMSDNLVIKSAQGQIAIDIPVSGIQSVTAASQISNAIIDARVAKAGEIGAVGNLASVSGITKMLTNPFQTGAQISQAQWQQDRADYNLTHQNIPPHTIGAASSAASWAIDLNCRLIIYYPTGEVIRDANPPEFILQKLAEYGHTTGFACCMTGQLKEFLGLTVGINADLNGIRTNSGVRPATLQELQLLEAALEEGVIL